jgi:Zn-finger nucleic acid-binding protein
VMRLECSRCNGIGTDRGDWNGVFRQGFLVAVLCPNCQSVGENAEAAVNEAMLDYGVNAFGLPVSKAK